MGLTQEQIAFEKDWARRYGDAATSMEFEKWAAFLKGMLRCRLTTLV